MFVSCVDKMSGDLVRVQAEHGVSEEILKMMGLDVTHLSAIVIGHKIVDKPLILLGNIGACFTENVDGAARRPVVNKF